MSNDVIQSSSEINEKKKSLRAFGSHIPVISTPLDESTISPIKSDTSHNTLYTVQGKFSALSVIIDRDNEASFNKAEELGFNNDPMDLTNPKESEGENAIASLSNNIVAKLPAIPKREASESTKSFLKMLNEQIAEGDDVDSIEHSLSKEASEVAVKAKISEKTSLFHNLVSAKNKETQRFRSHEIKAKKTWKKAAKSAIRMSTVGIEGPEEQEQIVDVESTIIEEEPEEEFESELNINTEKKSVVPLANQVAKIFIRTDKEIVSDTPTIFALLRATHILGVAAITHRPRQDQAQELSAYERTLRQYLAFLPDMCIVNTLRQNKKSLETIEGVTMFADVSGFTVLCAKYGTVNISKLKNTLNHVMSAICEEILGHGGDIVSFAGDAIFAVWRTHSVEERTSILPKIVKCSINIQEAVNLKVDKTITLRVKVGLAVGKMFTYYLESAGRDHVAVVGPAVKDVNKAEGCCISGMIVCSAQFLEEFPEKESYPYTPTGRGFVQLWPPKGPQSVVLSLLERLGSGNHTTLDRCRVVTKIADDLVKQDLLKRYIPDYLRFQLEEGQGTSWASQMRSITTVFISLVLADSETVSGDHSNVQEALTCIDEIVDKMNGTVNKIFTFDKGCTILVAFGTQGFKMNDDPRRALKCAQLIMSDLQNVNDFKGVSIGVTTGLCFCGVVGHDERHEYTVIGHQVNLACRIMSNYPFCVACDESTKKLSILNDGLFTILPPKVLKGVPPGGLYYKYHEVHTTLGNVANLENQAVTNLDKNTRLIGRAAELDALYGMMANVESSEGKNQQNIIIIEAQAGYGKSRLLEHYSVIGRHRKYTTIMAPLVIDEMTTPFYAVKFILYNVLGLNKPGNAKNKEGVIARFIPEYLRDDMCLLNDLLGTRFKRDSTRDFSYKNLHKLLKEIIAQVVGSDPYLFLIDNAEYMDQQSWEFMTDLTSIKRKTILILSMRSTSKRMTRAENMILEHKKAKRFVLEPFTTEELLDFSRAYLEVRAIPLDLEKVIIDKTHGIPLYCEGLLSKMLKEQVITIIDERYEKDNNHGRRDSMGSRVSKFGSFAFGGGANMLKMVEEQSKQSLEMSPMESLESDRKAGCCPSLFRGSKGADVKVVYSVDSLEDEMTPRKETKHCVLNDSVDITKVALPESVRELFLSQFDRLTVTEQVTIKCCAVLGTHFTLSLLMAVLPHRTAAQIYKSIKIMIKESMMECGGASKGFGESCKNLQCPGGKQTHIENIDNIAVCPMMKFKTQFSAEILRELLLPEQRMRIHEIAATALEKKILAYDFCCKKEFFGNVFKISPMDEAKAPTWAKDRRLSQGEQATCQCHDMFTTIYPQIIRHYREAGTNHSLFEALCSAGALGMALSHTFEALTYLEDALKLTKTRTRLNDRHKACLSSLLCLALYLCPTPTTYRLYKDAVLLSGYDTNPVIKSVTCFQYLCNERNPAESTPSHM